MSIGMIFCKQIQRIIFQELTIKQHIIRDCKIKNNSDKMQI